MGRICASKEVSEETASEKGSCTDALWTNDRRRRPRGLPRYSMVFPKQSKEWVAKKIYEPTSQYFTQHLVKRVLERREERTPEEIPHVQRPANIATKEKPKEDVIRKHQTRFPRHTDA
ncbi:unnamed protein product [Boreogadus saida]